ncbi:MAG: MerR family transcriptional regulator [Flavobacteriales bacterium]|nr:MerR family transcriptional regulator [Flavobacteriales bacterium]MCB9191393.1 MerR family transcriptional regulator [Flavobacteriales bacterium]MCB9203982.1 MerR family transcriptional regulator [Flavobacteriales bacterium]
MGQYSIKDLETLSGIKAHTIRIWEKRYGIITPDRTDTNIRTYCDSDLKKLLNIALLNNHGLKISKICKLNYDALCQEVEKVAQTDTSYPTYIDRLVVSMVDLDRPKFEAILKDGTDQLGFEDFCIHVLYPFLQKVGVMWMANSINPAQEHFISNLIIQKMYVATDKLYSSENRDKKAVFFLREGEMHEMGLLFFRYLMKKRGVEAIYLGQSVPMQDLKQVVQAHQPDYLVSAFVATMDEGVLESYLHSLADAFPKQKIIISGYQVSQYTGALPKNVIKTDDVQQYVDYIESQIN